jgi:hypothetical protein
MIPALQTPEQPVVGQNCKITKLQNCKIAKLQNCKIAKLQNCKIAKLQNCQSQNFPRRS